jgi:hypothetical protein
MDNIRSIHMNLHEFMCCYEAKMIKNTNNLFKQQFLLRLDDVLSKISVVDFLY